MQQLKTIHFYRLTIPAHLQFEYSSAGSPKLPPRYLQRLWRHVKFRCNKPCSLWDLESFGLQRLSLSRSISQSDCFLSSSRPARQTLLVKALAWSQGETLLWSPSQSLEEGIAHTRGKGIRTPLSWAFGPDISAQVGAFLLNIHWR